MSLNFFYLLCFITYCNCNIHRANPNYGPVSSINPVKDRNIGIIDEEEEEENLGFFDKIYQKAHSAWYFAIPAAFLVGSTGVFPLLIFKVEEGHELKEAVSPSNLKLLLSFAVGGLLGDVFLHLLPESWMYLDRVHDHIGGLKIGLWVLAGFLCFLILEKVFFEEEKLKEHMEKKAQTTVSKLHNSTSDNGTRCNGVAKKSHSKHDYENIKNGHSLNGHCNGLVKSPPGCNGNAHHESIVRKRKSSEDNKEPGDIDSDDEYSEDSIKVIGYLNLLANCIDNFTHGLAVAGSFVVSARVGVCTTFAILVHEIPHEIGDFAILLKAGFKRWDAAKGQILTASGALFGCIFGLLAEGAGDSSAWILPFTSGGFLYIALVTVVPDLLKEENPMESCKQIVALLFGLSTMGIVTLFHH